MSSEKWLNEEVSFLRENYEIIGPTKCSEKLGRTIRACQLKSKKMKLKFSELKNYYEKEKLLEIVNECYSYSDCLRKIGLTTRAGNNETLKKYIKLYDINISHFYTNKTEGLKKYTDNKKIKLENILVENSTYDRKSLKERLYKEGIKERICENCKQDENWKGKKMSLIIDHINGISDDNRLENLRILCPNCSATLDTHGGKNKGRK